MTYTLIRSKRKTIALQIKPTLEVIVRAPQRMPKYAIDSFVQAHEAWIATHLQRLEQRAAERPAPDAEALAMLRAQAQAHIPSLVRRWAQVMGLTPTAVKINAAKTRFGSCSGKNSLNFSCLLMRCPPEAIEYVVVHELAHIVHKNHSPAFHALVARYLPDHRERRKLLRG